MANIKETKIIHIKNIPVECYILDDGQQFLGSTIVRLLKSNPDSTTFFKDGVEVKAL